MRVVMEHERAQGRQVYDVSEKNLGYDVTSLDLASGELRLIEVKGLGAATGTILLTPNERRVAKIGRDCFWLYVVTDCDTTPRLQEPIRDPARLDWNEVTKVAHYYLSVNAMTKPMQVREDSPPVRRAVSMIPKDCKRLAEVDFPIAEVSRHAAREKSIRHGHPSTLHLWWARRPLASSRAVLLGAALAGPVRSAVPGGVQGEGAGAACAQVAGCKPGTTDEDLRKALLKFIADFANWDLAAQRTYLEVSRALVKAAHGEEPPLVVDPFAGGGSIPLEALRLGCEAFASDLNPVACLILKVMLEDIPRHGPKLAEELRRVGAEIKRQAEKELADLYPKDPDGATPIAYLWARTVRCESPNCGAEIPLVASFWLCKKAQPQAGAAGTGVVRPAGERAARWSSRSSSRRRRGGRARRHGDAREGATLTSSARAARGAAATEESACASAARGAARRGRCRLRREGSPHGRGADARRGDAPATASEGRHYRLPTERDYEAVRKRRSGLPRSSTSGSAAGKQGLCPVPDEPLPPVRHASAFSVPAVRNAPVGRPLHSAAEGGAADAGDAIAGGRRRGYARSGDPGAGLKPRRDHLQCACVGGWSTEDECDAHLFGRQALPIVWDFAEASILAQHAGDFAGNAGERGYELSSAVAKRRVQRGQVQSAMPANHRFPTRLLHVWFTDPPYYDAVPYADLSDFFFVWLKRALPGHPLLRDPFDADESAYAEGSRSRAGRDAGRRRPAEGSSVVRRDDGASLRRGAARSARRWHWLAWSSPTRRPRAGRRCSRA